MADIFISYATVDRLVVDRLVDALKACGWSVWWDHRSLRGGQRFDRIIEEAIRTARVVIVIWSKISVEREWVLDEATLALRMKKLVPLRIDMAHLPMRFSNIHTIDFSSWTGKTDAEPFKRLVEDLGHYLDPSAPSNRSEHPGIPAAPDPQTTTPVAESEQPAGTAPIIEHSQAPPNDGALQASTTIKSPTSTAKAISPEGRMRVGKYFASIAVAGGVLWGLIVLGEKQQPKIEASTEASTAQAAYNRGDYTTALSLAQPAAERGDLEAQYTLGRIYENSLGVPQDYIEAARWYRKAADQGNADAQLQLGRMYANRRGVQRNYGEAARWYQKAADQGNAEAQYNLGILYSNGQGVPQDMAQARAWMQKAAAGGDEDTKRGAKRWLEKN